LSGRGRPQGEELLLGWKKGPEETSFWKGKSKGGAGLLPAEHADRDLYRRKEKKLLSVRGEFSFISRKMA